MLLDSNLEYAVINTKKSNVIAKTLKRKGGMLLITIKKAALSPLQILKWGKKGDEAK